MTKFAFAALFFVSVQALATPPPFEVHCTISEVLDGGAFENRHDFSFGDNPNVAYIAETSLGKTLIIGALTFSENDQSQPVVITEDHEQRSSIITAEPVDGSEIFAIVVDDQKKGMLYYAEENIAPEEVAELNCGY